MKLADALSALAVASGEGGKATDAVAKHAGNLRTLLCGGGEVSPDPALARPLVAELCRQRVLVSLAAQLFSMPFESRKDAAAVWGAALHTAVDGAYPAVEALAAQPSVLDGLAAGYENPNIALTCGVMLREACRHEALAAHLLRSERFMEFFRYLDLPTFEVASDAFSTFRELLTRHKAVVAEYLVSHFEPFFAAYNGLLVSQNYVTRRQAVKLLGELLLDRANVQALMPYIAQVQNLMLMMNLLKDSSRSIQFEAFHIFKVFVANPQKPPAVLEILQKNRDKLLRYLAGFQVDREDEHFAEEKAILVRLLNELPEL